MRAVTFRGVERVAVEEKPEPRVCDPGDVVVEIELAGLCGSDLHPYQGRERGLDPGTTMGHEFVGTVIAAGSAVERFQPGDRVLSPFTTSCGCCGPCRRKLSSRCERGALFGWIEGGSGLEGAQAERVRVPLADTTLVRRADDNPPAASLLLGDVFTTGAFAVERLPDIDARPVGVVGLGAVGLSALLAFGRRRPATVFALDAVPERLALARELGGTPLDVRGDDARVRTAGDTAARLRRSGVPPLAAVVEAVGSPDSLRLAAELLEPGAFLSIASVHPEDTFALPPPFLYDRNLTVAMGRCPVRSRLDDEVERQRRTPLPLERLITHTVELADAPEIYRMFAERRDGCIKAVFRP